MNMNNSEIYQKLHKIYKKHQKRYKHNPDSLQMCVMWSTINPPDTLEDTKPIEDIKNTFDIYLEEEEAVELYDMDLSEAAKRIEEIIKEQN